MNKEELAKAGLDQDDFDRLSPEFLDTLKDYATCAVNSQDEYSPVRPLLLLRLIDEIQDLRAAKADREDY